MRSHALQEVRDLHDPAIRELRHEASEDDIALLEGDPAGWYEALTAAIREVDSQLSSKTAELEAFRQECFHQGESGKRSFFRQKSEHDLWRAKATGFKRHLESRASLVRRLRHETNTERNRDRSRDVLHQIEDYLLDDANDLCDVCSHVLRMATELFETPSI